ncbi:MAG: prepilin-type N-terminal cleavage/methylation domain-containing protein [Dehalococcoidia bacterium]
MRRVTLSKRLRRALRGASGGMTLIEVLIALALFSIIAITFLGGLTTASRAVLLGDIRTTAESLARAQMEHVKNQPYVRAEQNEVATYPKIGTIPHGYTICSLNRGGELVNCGYSQDIIAIPWDSMDDGQADIDVGLQKVTLIINHNDKVIITLEGYKRGLVTEE